LDQGGACGGIAWLRKRLRACTELIKCETINIIYMQGTTISVIEGVSSKRGQVPFEKNFYGKH